MMKLNPIDRIRAYVAWRIRRHRLLAGLCVACGVGRPLHGALCCRACFEHAYPYLTGRKP